MSSSTVQQMRLPCARWAMSMLQLAVHSTIHVANECRWEEWVLAYTLAGAGIELFENIDEGLE
jgi:hypothetical protein